MRYLRALAALALAAFVVAAPVASVHDTVPRSDTGASFARNGDSLKRASTFSTDHFDNGGSKRVASDDIEKRFDFKSDHFYDGDGKRSKLATDTFGNTDTKRSKLATDTFGNTDTKRSKLTTDTFDNTDTKRSTDEFIDPVSKRGAETLSNARSEELDNVY